jgi:Type VI secretion system/phage-baseplate injector OB domain
MHARARATVPKEARSKMSEEHEEGGGRGRFGVYLGRVMDNRDPEQRGRVRVLVPIVNANEILPTWAFPAGQSYGGRANNSRVAGAPARGPVRGSFIVPEIDATVMVMFLDGNPELPMWWPGPPPADGIYPEVKSGTRAGTDTYPSKSMLVRGRALRVLEKEMGSVEVSMDNPRDISIETGGGNLRVRTLPSGKLVINDGAASQFSARVGDDVDIGDFSFVGAFSPSSGALTSLTITFPDGTSHTLTALSPTATFTNVKGTVATGSPSVLVGGTKTRPS